MIETERLILRPWSEADAEPLYAYASNPKIGYMAGWPPHKSVEDSLNVIRNVLSAPETYAVLLKSSDKPIGSAGLTIGVEHFGIVAKKTEAIIGYWLGEPFWGMGLIPEAVMALLERSFTTLDLTAVWCSYYDTNGNSRRVAEKCGFKYKYSLPQKTLMGEDCTLDCALITREEYFEMKR